ncbi:MAG: phage virion morphogenesis protein [Candidatus Accumulibacter sp.]|jgi:phage virion morphogenesis protein|nr:phage virion morphogenesis protein [Accumulibacter sp.]
MPITIDVNSANVQAALKRLSDAAMPGGMETTLKKIGQELVESTRARFVTSTAPDGSHWQPNAPATYLKMVSRSDTYSEGANRGRVRSGRTGALMGKKPLVDTGAFSRSFNYQRQGDTLLVGTNYLSETIKSGGDPIGMAVHQFGTTRAGRSRNVTIPARPFLGISADDETMIEHEITDHLRSQIS